jgi:hypothetical protein
MFSGCTLLDSIKIPSDVSFIGESAFENCENLKTLSIPSSVTSIEDYAFKGCSALVKLIFEDGDENLSLGCNNIGRRNNGQGLLYDCPIQELYVGRDLLYNSEKKYGYSPFYNKTEFNNIIIGEQVTNIGANEFSGCSGLNTILLPKSITNIDDSAFAGCSISSVVSLNTNPPTLLQNAFDDTVYNNAITYVPASSMPSYQTAAGWQNFMNYESIDDNNSVSNIINDADYSISIDGNNIEVIGNNPIRIITLS